MRYRRKSVLVDVFHYEKSNLGDTTKEWPLWLLEAIGAAVIFFFESDRVFMRTRNGGILEIFDGDYIIQSDSGDLELCKSGEFLLTYEKAE